MLKTKAAEVTDIDGKLVRLADDMIEAMYDAPGLGLAAPQVGVQKQLFVYDIGDGPDDARQPGDHGVRGEWVYDEGCLSIPGLYVEIAAAEGGAPPRLRPRRQRGRIEADELLARLFQHELDHLDGVLMFDRMTRRAAQGGADGVAPLQAEPARSARSAQAAPAAAASRRR